MMPNSTWLRLQNLWKTQLGNHYGVACQKGRRPSVALSVQTLKGKIVEQNEYLNKRQRGEEFAEFQYSPLLCNRSYRMIVVRKQIDARRKHQARSALFLKDKNDNTQACV